MVEYTQYTKSPDWQHQKYVDVRWRCAPYRPTSALNSCDFVEWTTIHVQWTLLVRAFADVLHHSWAMLVCRMSMYMRIFWKNMLRLHWFSCRLLIGFSDCVCEFDLSITFLPHSSQFFEFWRSELGTIFQFQLHIFMPCIENLLDSNNQKEQKIFSENLKKNEKNEDKNHGKRVHTTQTFKYIKYDTRSSESCMYA